MLFAVGEPGGAWRPGGMTARVNSIQTKCMNRSALYIAVAIQLSIHCASLADCEDASSRWTPLYEKNLVPGARIVSRKIG